MSKRTTNEKMNDSGNTNETNELPKLKIKELRSTVRTSLKGGTGCANGFTYAILE